MARPSPTERTERTRPGTGGAGPERTGDRAGPSGAGGTTTARRAPRLPRADRRAALLDAAIAIAAEHGVAAVSMETVAARARVSRPLLYKHFANAAELLAAAYRREMAALEDEVAAAVDQAADLESAARALVGAVIDEAERRGALLTRLIRAGARDTQTRQEQRDRERRTVRYFAKLAERELGLAHRDAVSTVRVLMTGIDSVIHQWHERPTAEQRAFLEDVYVAAFLGGLEATARHRGAVAGHP
ncbi:MAG: TetR/AcrR family transcriptional regulator [Acidimicrobiales bacterium]